MSCTRTMRRMTMIETKTGEGPDRSRSSQKVATTRGFTGLGREDCAMRWTCGTPARPELLRLWKMENAFQM